MKKIVFILLIAITGLKTTQAIDHDSLFQKANEAYANGFYLEAIDQYLKIVDMGFESADLYFNTGNACFKLEDYPSAILYYEKAKKLAPNDEDINFNLAIANTRIVDKIEPVPEIFFRQWWRAFTNLLGTDTWAMLGVGTFILFFILLAFYLLSRVTRIRKASFYTGLVVLFISLFAFFVSLQKYRSFQLDREAIVFTPTITVKSSPNPNSVDLFVIHEGSKVRIMDQVGEWCEIRIANGSVGWLPVSSIRKI
jgi:tetratricopeptide (TPR) repeat protein